jgi:N-acetylglucosaminyldiphosphoundecaprenol N-acetyl-beta-D-mannosaminyltransferase
MPKVTILGVEVDVITGDELQGAIARSISSGRKEVFAYANIHGVNIARRDESFRDFLNEAAVVYCDGEGVRLGAKILGYDLPERIVLTRWVWELCSFCERHGFTVFILGGSTTAVEGAVRRIRFRFPRIMIVGWHHGYFDKEGPESDRIVEMIGRVRPNVLFVGFGMPLQEHWIRANFEKLCANAILPAGSMIEYAAGRRATAPRWMAEKGFEWLFRLVQEPGRLWGRYVLGNPLFMCRIIMQLIRQERRP